MANYALKRELAGVPFMEALAKTREALAAQGFGIPTAMDTQSIFREKLGKESEARVILGACLAPVAFQALAQEPEIALLLPCNVVVREVEGGTEVSAIAPRVLFSLTEKVSPEFAAQVEARLQAALDAL